MKSLLSCAFVLIASQLVMAQTIHRVNVDATVTGANVHTTIQAAHDAATAGDVIIVEPGAFSAGALNCAKTLTIYGRGYFLENNAAYAQLSNKAQRCILGVVTISANNVKLSGLTTSTIYVSAGTSGTNITRTNLSDIRIEGLASQPIINVTVSQCFISGGVVGVDIKGAATGVVSSVTIANNLILTNLTGNANTSSILFDHNTITTSSPSFYNAIVTNNIFTHTSLVITDANAVATTVNYNVHAGTISTSSMSNNLLVANLNTMYVGNVAGPDNDYRPNSGTPPKTASSTGAEVGMFGGSAPYIQYGIPAAPVVLKFTNTGLGNNSTPVVGTISGASNN